jgi:hypothetical protein
MKNVIYYVKTKELHKEGYGRCYVHLEISTEFHVYATFPKSIMKVLHKGSGRVEYCIREEIESNLSQPIIAPVSSECFVYLCAVRKYKYYKTKVKVTP